MASATSAKLLLVPATPETTATIGARSPQRAGVAVADGDAVWLELAVCVLLGVRVLLGVGAT